MIFPLVVVGIVSMAGKRDLKWLTIFFIVILLSFLIFPARTNAKKFHQFHILNSDEDWDPHGPYVDNVTFHVIESQNAQVNALISGQIDHITSNLDSSTIEMLKSYPDVELTNTSRLGFGYLAINCERYPFSIPAFRQALAFAANKSEIAHIMWGELGFPLNTPVPPACGIWHANISSPDYTDPNIEAARAELAAAGFTDIDGDGYVETPNGTTCIFRPMYSISAPQWGEMLESQVKNWKLAGLNVVPLPNTLCTLWNTLLTIPRNYDGACITWVTDSTPRHLQMFTSDQMENPEGNFLNWQNSTYDYFIECMLNASTQEAAVAAAHAAQQVIVEDVPMVTCYNKLEVNAHWANQFEGWVVSPGYGIGCNNLWTPRIVRLSPGHPNRSSTGTGGTFNTMISSSMDTQNPLMSTSIFGLYPLSQIYTSLIGDLDPYDLSVTKRGGGIAYDWVQTELPDRQQYDFYLVSNATWHDFHPVTANDVAFTYNYIVNHSLPLFRSVIPYLNACYAINPYQVRLITNGKSYWRFRSINNWPILPQHTWERIESPGTYTNPYPIGCGPFKWVNRLEGSIIHLEYWPYYHCGLPRPHEPPPAPSLLSIIIMSGAAIILITLIGSIVYLKLPSKTSS